MRKIINPGNSEEVPFNMAIIWYMNLSDLIKAKDSAYMRNDLKDWYKSLSCIYNKVLFKLDEQEEKEIDDLFLEVKSLIFNNGDKKIIADKLHLIDRKIIKCMDKYKMIFPRINTLYGMDKVRSKYNLDNIEEGVIK